ncbi:dihydroxyacetone kinase subunit L [Spirochaetia bacterium]|nr:dihydroxyacetone kinase subunit L [Spirochaetia bacterium]
MSLNTDKVRSIIGDIAAVIGEQKQYLSDLDQAIGDGDHGFNMARGFDAVMQKLKDAPGADIGEVLKTTAMALISNVGGASGPLYGTLFLKAAELAKGLTELDLAGFVPILKKGILGVQDRGKAELGEKTMIDVLLPVLGSLEKDSAAGLSGKEAFANADKLAAECVAKTKDIIAKKGRASYLGERSIGHIDPGAESSHLMISVISKALA